MDAQLIGVGALFLALVLFELLAWWKAADSTDGIDAEEWQRRWMRDF